MCTSKHRLIRNTSVLPVSVRQQCRDCRWFLQHCEKYHERKNHSEKNVFKILLIGLLERFCHSDVLWSLFIHLLHAHPQPLTGRQGLSEQQETSEDKWEWMTGRIQKTFSRMPALFTLYSLTISGTWSFSSSFCCILSNLSMQWWQQRIFSSSFSSSMDVTLLRLLRLPLLGPNPLLLPPGVSVWEWTGLPAMQWASRVPLLSFSVSRSKADDLTALYFQEVFILYTYEPKARGQIPCTSYTWWTHRDDSGVSCFGC